MDPIQFGNYTLLERLNYGGMAEVFRAQTRQESGCERIVAVKMLLPAIAADEQFVTMLIDEAKIAGQLTHTNIAQIFDLGEVDGQYYIVQEYVQGLNLRAILSSLPPDSPRLGVAEACHIAIMICEGLGYAHNKKSESGSPLHLVHRDISPQNIMISVTGEVKIVDFGIAKAEGRATDTGAGHVKGKTAYMSPEQARGETVDHRSDLFAVGIVLYELITGQALFRGRSEYELLRLVRDATVCPPSQKNPAIPVELDHIVLTALARKPDDRFQTVSQLQDALWHFTRKHGPGVQQEDLAILVNNAMLVPKAAPSTRQAGAESGLTQVDAATLDTSRDLEPAPTATRKPDSENVLDPETDMEIDDIATSRFGDGSPPDLYESPVPAQSEDPTYLDVASTDRFAGTEARDTHGERKRRITIPLEPSQESHDSLLSAPFHESLIPEELKHPINSPTPPPAQVPFGDPLQPKEAPTPPTADTIWEIIYKGPQQPRRAILIFAALFLLVVALTLSAFLALLH